jgi:hypothetical protein
VNPTAPSPPFSIEASNIFIAYVALVVIEITEGIGVHVLVGVHILVVHLLAIGLALAPRAAYGIFSGFTLRTVCFVECLNYPVQPRLFNSCS